ncbi:MAG: hypothetical protein ACRELY_12615 [Polyangiaceae bacterium]
MRSFAVGAAILVLVACTKHEGWEQGGVAGNASAAPVSVDSGNHVSLQIDAAASAGAPVTEAIDPAFFEAKPLTGKSIGHTSIVFKLGLEGGKDAAYKPRSKVGNERFRGEIAAYRLALAWGLHNVPAAVFRSFPAAALDSAMGNDDKASSVFTDQVVVEPDGNVRGALIPWISHLQFMPLEKDPDRAKWKGWLESPALDVGTMPPCDRDLARQISTMIAFDVLTGNWDRWSGGNIGNALGSGCTTVLYIDNDGAFFDPVPKLFFDPQVAELHKVRRFSRSFVSALRSTTEDALRSAIGEESPGKPLLPEHVVTAFFARRKLVLDAIDDASKKWGETDTLSLP